MSLKVILIKVDIIKTANGESKSTAILSFEWHNNFAKQKNLCFDWNLKSSHG